MLVVFNVVTYGNIKTDKEEILVEKNVGTIPLEKVDRLEITGLDIKKALAEDAANKKKNPDKSRYRIGLIAQVDVTTGTPASGTRQVNERGTWEKLNDGRYLWRLKVRSVGAIGLSFGFTSYHMPEKASFSIYSSDHTWVAGPYTSKDNKSHGQLWTPAILGEEVVFELTIPEDRIKELNLVLGSVTHLYRNSANTDKSGSCNVDVVCSGFNGWEEQIRSVARYSYSDGNSSYVCTGSLINNTNNDGIPYFLTAHHCVKNSTVAATVVVTWDYESATCRPIGSTESGTPLPVPGNSQSGSTLRATYAASDFTLLELDNAPEPKTNAFWSGWDRSGINPSSGVTIHHPAGHAKRISKENEPLTTTSYLYNTVPGDSTHFRVEDWDSGTTEGGSSGSGLWDENGLIVGQLHGGSAGCGNDNPDWFGRLFTSWTGGGTSATRLSDWLDPLNTENMTLLGYEGNGTAIRSGFNAETLSGNDDEYTDEVPIGFNVNFFGNQHSTLYVNNNGNITFDRPLATYTPFDLTTTEQEIIAPFFSDVDTRNSADVTYGQGMVNGKLAFAVNWINVGYFESHNAPLNSFQLVIIDRSDIAPGDFDIEFNYSHIGWETGDASDGVGGFGGFSARVGYSNGTRESGTFYEMIGSAVNGAFLDSGYQSLISRKFNSNTLGRYIYEARSGVIFRPIVIYPWILFL